jgi:adenine-specific DNA-methyltransferase
MAKAKVRVAKKAARLQQAESYKHPESESPMRPDVGTQAQFKKKKPPVTYRYDSSLSPALDWDGQNGTRELGEWLLAVIEEAAALPPPHRFKEPRRFYYGRDANGKPREFCSVTGLQDAIERFKALSQPFLNWAGKAERLSFDVPTIPLFVHERLSTKAIIETLTSHKRDKQMDMYSLFGDQQHSITDQVLRAYEHRDKWVNRMILGDSLVVMNSLLHYEGLGGQVQMIYMEPPYGVKFGSNFQPIVRKRDVTHGDDEDMTREPEMVQAYRDTWELGLHSYLTYLRDRFLLCRELLAPSGSIFVQISDENLHHVREVMDGVFGPENFICLVVFVKTTGFSGKTLSSIADFILWYAKDAERLKYRQLFGQKEAGEEGATKYRPVRELGSIPPGRFESERLATVDQLTSQGALESEQSFEYEGRIWRPPAGMHYKTTVEGLERLAEVGRIVIEGNSIRYVRFLDDFPVFPLANIWEDIGGIQSRTEGKIYVVQTAPLAIERCVLMSTDPGDLVLDPTCGSGTTAYVAEQWGRRWITIDTSRVPLALARQRLLTATFPWYQLKDEARGPAGGFVYVRKQNKKGEEIGGIVPHITLESIANNEPPKEEVLVDRPEVDNKITRVTGPFCVEGTIPTPIPADAGDNKSQIADSKEGEATYVDRMLEVLSKSPVLRLSGNRTVTLRNIRPPAKTLSLSAEAVVEGNGISPSPEASGGSRRATSEGSQISDSGANPVALVFGPENGAVSERLVQEAAKEAALKNYTHLYVIGFAIQPNARQLIENCDAVAGIPTTYIQATPDLMMGDLRKNMRSSQIFSVCGLPEIKIHRVGKDGGAASRKPAAGAESQIADSKFQSTAGAGSQVADSRLQDGCYQVELLGLDVFDPVTMEVHHRQGEDVPAWFSIHITTDFVFMFRTDSSRAPAPGIT